MAWRLGGKKRFRFRAAWQHQRQAPAHRGMPRAQGRRQGGSSQPGAGLEALRGLLAHILGYPEIIPGYPRISQDVSRPKPFWEGVFCTRAARRRRREVARGLPLRSEPEPPPHSSLLLAASPPRFVLVVCLCGGFNCPGPARQSALSRNRRKIPTLTKLCTQRPRVLCELTARGRIRCRDARRGRTYAVACHPLASP